MKFVKGEIAIIATNGWGPQIGDEVEVIEVGPFPAEHRTIVKGERFATPRPKDYIIWHRETGGWYVLETSLRKRPQRGIPDEVRAVFDVPVKSKAPA